MLATKKPTPRTRCRLGKGAESGDRRGRFRRRAARGAVDAGGGAPFGQDFRLVAEAVAAQRCGQPGQQHGRRRPLRILSSPTSMRRCRFSSFLAEVIQQIHSFRARGVKSCHRRGASASASRACRKSAGSSWTVPPGSLGVVMVREDHVITKCLALHEGRLTARIVSNAATFEKQTARRFPGGPLFVGGHQPVTRTDTSGPGCRR